MESLLDSSSLSSWSLLWSDIDAIERPRASCLFFLGNGTLDIRDPICVFSLRISTISDLDKVGDSIILSPAFLLILSDNFFFL